jgi:hypothetical protein
MAKRKRGTEVFLPPWLGLTVPEGHRNDFQPSVINITYARVLWITAEKVIEPEVVSFHWVWADYEGQVKDQFTGTKEQLPAKWQKRLIPA